MGRMRNAVVGQGTAPAEEEAASTPSAAADIPRKTLSAWATWTARETLRRQEASNLPTCIPLEAAACLANSVKKPRGVATESTKICDRKGNLLICRGGPL
jgi:hypothetical protein